MEEELNYLSQVFETIFKREVEEDRLLALVKFWGIEKVTDTLNYLLITGAWPVKEGSRDNPYGLIYKICKNCDFTH